ncbi:dTDP-4-dehydrorhamnose 3,5-epimerase [Bdellovibrio sp. 22V]|uniref:dTDP-4-dehydrorhamnose 3,5-epimerase n=1 Tax=Bdellovibrio sp. 22V TaxID=3044166 RepID=UPI002543EB48|nr:dTDP-4-dehydrorhamnose 3,5-epimerase [Bdellovibrio sp. 22V]WII71841.1 dTDP-4-dehydrorhamnose 3,5-epimerase [Bdellovibrio sp. 22V]
MQLKPTTLENCYLIEPKVYSDDRGFFFESFNQRKFNELIGNDSYSFVQDNHSKSSKGVLRGLHYQIQHPQGKLVRVTQGEVFDVAVDLRKSSATFGKWFGTVLSAENKLQLWMPPGFAHGFVVLSETAEFLYKTTDFYAPEYERCLMWNDRDLKIDWTYAGEPILSEKDKKGMNFKNAEVFP